MSSNKNKTPVRAMLKDGRQIPISTCECARCENQWFVPAWSDEFFPGWCCYCGMRFEGVDVIDTQIEKEQP